MICVHALFNKDGSTVHGTGSFLPELFSKHGTPWVCIKSPIYGGQSIRVECLKNGHVQTKTLSAPTSPSLFRKSVQECLALFKYIKQQKHIALFIGIDPLNALFGLLAKRFLGNIRSVVYYTADYADVRFANPLINAIYHHIDRYVAHHADQVWNVSVPIYTLRTRQGVGQDKNYFIPNTPLRVPINHRVHKKKFDLIVVGTSTIALNFRLLLDAFSELAKRYPSMRLHIIGELTFSDTLLHRMQKYVAKKRILLHGPQNHTEVLNLLEHSGIGLALYTNKSSWTAYGDSMKIREYLACGLPVIATDIVSTSQVLQDFQCGEITPPRKRALVSAVAKILENKRYSIYEKNTRRATQAYNPERLVRIPLLKMGISL